MNRFADNTSSSFIKGTRWYVETSALNFLAGRLAEHDALATRQYQESLHRVWLMSPATFIEVSLTNQIAKRDKLLGVAQHLLHYQMMPSIEDLTVALLQGNTSCITETDLLIKFQSEMAKHWSKMCFSSSHQYCLNRLTLLHNVRILRILGSHVRKVILGTPNGPFIEGINYGPMFEISDNMVSADVGEEDNFGILTRRVAMILVALMFCGCVTLAPDPFRVFWEMQRINDEHDRLAWVMTNMPYIVTNGPFADMALMAVAQCRAGANRGTIFDMYHFAYTRFVSCFLTNDDHFLDVLQYRPGISNILMLRSAQITERQHRINHEGRY